MASSKVGSFTSHNGGIPQRDVLLLIQSILTYHGHLNFNSCYYY